MPWPRLLVLGAAISLVTVACAGSPSEETSSDDSVDTTSSAPPTSASTTVEQVESIPSDEITVVTEPDWVAVNIGRGVKPALALDSSGNPGIAWILERLDGFIAYASASDSWDVQMVAEGYFYGPIDLAFDNEDGPNIVIHDHQDSTFQQELGDLARLALDGSEWVVDTATDEGHDGWDSTIAIGADGTIHAAGVDPAQFGRIEGVEYYRKTQESWDVTQIGSGPIQYQYNVSLALDRSGSPHLTYYDDARGDLMLAGASDGVWEIEPVATEGDVGKYSSLAFTQDDSPAMTFFSQDSPSTGEIQFAQREGEAWTIETVGVLSAFSEGNARRNSSLAFDSVGRPHVVFSDTSGVWYSVRTESGWETSQIAMAERPLGQLVSFAIGPDDRPHVAFYEVTNQSELDGLVVYVTKS